LTLASVYIGEDSTASLPKLGMIAFGLARLMPSVARIVHSCQSVVYGWPCVKVLKEEIGNWKLERCDSEAKAECSFEKSFELDDVSFAYLGSSEKSLKNTTIKVRKGLSVGIIGESGSGKSTLVDIALGLLDPEEGSILVDGKRLGEEVSKSSWHRMVGYVPQEIFMTDDSLLNNVALGMDPRKICKDRVLKCLQEASLGSLVKELPLGLDTIMGERGTRFSGGQKQRVGIARALYHDPSFIVFDEATSSLDSETEQGVMKTVRDLQKTKTFLIVAHRLSTLKDCDVIYKIRDGRVVASGSFKEMTEV
jgi:ABC-type multidrug transport system fused ATPase/permease subunit